MRDYEHSDTTSFNTYRSGHENPHREHSYRTGFGSPASVHRRGDSEATADHYQKDSVWHQPQDYRDLRSQDNQSGYRSQQNDWNQQNDYNRPNQDNYRNQDFRNQNYRNQDYRSQDQNRWPRDNRQYQDNYGNHSQDRDWDSHRSGNRDYYENRNEDRNQSWNRWDEGKRYENQNDYRSYDDRNRPGAHRGYSADYGYQNPTNQGRGFDENRYQHRRTDQDDDRHDEGFFDRMGHTIREAWHRFTDEEREDQNRANRYEDRHGSSRGQDNRRNYNQGSGYNGPPGSWGSSSAEDYRW